MRRTSWNSMYLSITGHLLAIPSYTRIIFHGTLVPFCITTRWTHTRDHAIIWFEVGSGVSSLSTSRRMGSESCGSFSTEIILAKPIEYTKVRKTVASGGQFFEISIENSYLQISINVTYWYFYIGKGIIDANDTIKMWKELYQLSSYLPFCFFTCSPFFHSYFFFLFFWERKLIPRETSFTVFGELAITVVTRKKVHVSLITIHVPHAAV